MEAFRLPIDIIQGELGNLIDSKCVDRQKKNHCAVPDVSGIRVANAFYQALHIFPGGPLGKTFMAIQAGLVDGLCNIRRTPRTRSRITEERPERVGAAGNGGPCPSVRSAGWKKLRDLPRRHGGYLTVTCY